MKLSRPNSFLLTISFVNIQVTQPLLYLSFFDEVEIIIHTIAVEVKLDTTLSCQICAQNIIGIQ